MADDVSIEIKLDTGEVIKGFAKISESAKKAGDEVKKSFDTASGSENGGGSSGLLSGITSLSSGFVAAAAAIAGAIYSVSKFVHAANEQDAAINDLNRSLKISGIYSAEVSQNFQDLASVYQRNTEFGDEVIIQNMALIQSLANLSENGLKQATKAAMDLSAGLGIDLSSAAMLVGKAANGEVGALSRYGLKIAEGATQAETFANALQKINGQFSGAAESKVQTFAGQLSQLKNAMSDLTEEIGMFITKSDTFKSIVSKTTGFFNEMTEKAKQVREVLYNPNGKTSLQIELEATNAEIERTKKIIEEASKPAEGFFGKLLSGSNGSAAKSTIEYLDYIEKRRADLEQKLGGLDQKAKSDTTGNIQRNSFDPALQKQRMEYSAKFDQEMLAKKLAYDQEHYNITEDGAQKQELLAQINGDRKLQIEMEYAQKEKDLKAAYAESIAKDQVGARQDMNDKLREITEQRNLDLDNLDKKFVQDSTKNMTALKKSIGDTIQNGMVQMLAQGFSKIGQVLVQGGNIMEAFSSTVYTIFGGMLEQIGTAMIGTGLGLETLKAAMTNLFTAGPALVLAGLMVVALGGAIKAMASSPASTVGYSTGANSSPTVDHGTYIPTSATSTTSASNSMDQQKNYESTQQEAKQTVAVHIHGNVFNNRETGLEIVKIINDAIGNEGAALRGAYA